MGEFWEALRAYREEKEADRRHLGELARGHAVRIINLFVKKGSQFKDVTKFWRMPWDEEEESLDDKVKQLNGLSDEERNELAQKFIKSINKNG